MITISYITCILVSVTVYTTSVCARPTMPFRYRSDRYSVMVGDTEMAQKGFLVAAVRFAESCRKEVNSWHPIVKPANCEIWVRDNLTGEPVRNR